MLLTFDCSQDKEKAVALFIACSVVFDNHLLGLTMSAPFLEADSLEIPEDSLQKAMHILDEADINYSLPGADHDEDEGYDVGEVCEPSAEA